MSAGTYTVVVHDGRRTTTYADRSRGDAMREYHGAVADGCGVMVYRDGAPVLSFGGRQCPHCGHAPMPGSGHCFECLVMAGERA